MNIAIVAGLSTHKLKTTLIPFIENNALKRIYLIRRKPFHSPRIICCSAPKILGNIFTGELYRILTLFYLCLFRKVDLLIGIHFIFHGIYAALFGILFRIPYILYFIEDPKKYFHNWLFRFLIRHAKYVGVRGSRSKQYLIDIIGCQPSQIFIPKDIYVFQAPNSISMNEKKYDLVFIGNLVKEKRPDILVRVVERLKSFVPGIRVVLIGDGPLRESVRQLITALNLNQNIDLLGYQDDISFYIKQSKIFILTSQTEGLPTVLLDAMNGRLPLIVPDVGDIVDVAQHNVNALVAQPLNVDQFVQNCVKFLTDQELYHRFVANIDSQIEAKRIEHGFGRVFEIWNKVLTN